MSSATGQPSTQTIRFISYNLLVPSYQTVAKPCLPRWEVRVHEIFKKIKEADPDVGLLQEVQLTYSDKQKNHKAFALLEKMLIGQGYKVAIDLRKHGHNAHKEGTAIFYKPKFKEISRCSVSLKDDTGRRLQALQLAPHNGRGSFTVFNTHLMYEPTKSTNEMRAALKTMDDMADHGPQIFGGDWNVTPESSVVGLATKANFVDVLREKGVRKGTHVIGDLCPGIRIDYLCARGIVGIRNAAVVGSIPALRTEEEPSDHLMILADLELPIDDIEPVSAPLVTDQEALFRKDVAVLMKMSRSESPDETIEMVSQLSQTLSNRLYGLTYFLERKKGTRTDHLDFGRVAFLNQEGRSVSDPSIRHQAVQLLVLEKVIIPLLTQNRKAEALQIFGQLERHLQNSVFGLLHTVEKERGSAQDIPSFGKSAFLGRNHIDASNASRIEAISRLIADATS